MKLSNKFQVLQDFDEENTLEQQWHNDTETITSACKEVVGHKKRQQKEWISVETLKKMEIRKQPGKQTKAGVKKGQSTGRLYKGQ